MKSNLDEGSVVAEESLSRIRDGVDRRITGRRRRRGLLAAGGLVIAAGAVIGAGVAWPNAHDSAYISCIDPRVDGAFSTGVGFDMSDPVGFCLDDGSYRDGKGVAFNWGADLTREDLVACRLADGVAGVYVRSSGDCDFHGNTDWTAADVKVAVGITEKWREWHIDTFGFDPMPGGFSTTPSQIVTP